MFFKKFKARVVGAVTTEPPAFFIMDKKSYYAIIPANVRYDKNLKANAKLLYGEITALANEKGFCWSTNNYFAQLYDVSKVSVSKWVSDLEKGGYISLEMVYKTGTNQIEQRKILLQTLLKKTLIPIKEKLNTLLKKSLIPLLKKSLRIIYIIIILIIIQ